MPRDLDGLAREGARRMLAVALELEGARRGSKVNEVIPLLYLRGLSTGDFREALPVLLGEAASGLSPASISRQIGVWEAEVAAWRERDLSDVDYVYVWADGVHVKVRLGEQDRLCLLVMVGVRPDGTKELIAVEDGYRESTESWAHLLRDLKRRGMRAPALALERRGRRLAGRRGSNGTGCIGWPTCWTSCRSGSRERRRPP